MRILIALCAGILPAAAANAAIITQYGTAGSVTSLAPVAVDASVTADNLEAGSGLNVQAFSTFNFSGWDMASTSFADAVAADDIWTWGFDVVSGPLDLTTMDIRLDRSGSGPDDFEIQVSVNGGTPSTVLTHDYNDSSAGVNFTGVDLSSVSGLTAGDSVVFTLGAFNSESDNGTFDLETITFPGGTDGITINGNVVPEPTAVALALLSLAAVAGRKRG